MAGFSRALRSAAGLLLVASLPFGASSVRVEVESQAEAAIDWRKLAAASALGAHAVSAQMAGELGGRGTVQLGRAQQKAEELDETNIAIVETLIVGVMGGHHHKEAQVMYNFEELVRSFRRQDGDLADQLCKQLNFLRVKRPSIEEIEWWTNVVKPAESAGGTIVEPSSAEYHGTRGGRARSSSGDDGTGSVLKRYGANEPRGAEEILALEKLLRDVKRPSEEEGHEQFVRLFVRSSSGDPSGELTVTYAPLSMSLRRYLEERDVTLMQRLGIFFDLLVGVADVYRRESPVHGGVVCADNVLVTGDVASAKASFCPAFFEAEAKACSTQADFWPLLFSEEAPYSLPEMIKADTFQLGELLDFLVRTSSDGVQEDRNALLVLASAMKAGIFDSFEGGEGVVWEFMVIAMARTMLTGYQEALTGAAAPASAFSETDFLTTRFEQALANPTEPSSAFWRNIHQAVLAGRTVGAGHAMWAGRPTPVPYYKEAEISG